MPKLSDELLACPARARSSAATDVVLSLAKRHGLVIYDPQGDEVTGLGGDYKVPVGLGD